MAAERGFELVRGLGFFEVDKTVELLADKMAAKLVFLGAVEMVDMTVYDSVVLMVA